MTNLPAPYATYSQSLEAWGGFVAGSGNTVKVGDALLEMSVQDGFCVWMVREDVNGDHYALDADAAREMGVL